MAIRPRWFFASSIDHCIRANAWDVETRQHDYQQDRRRKTKRAERSCRLAAMAFRKA
jgi:hypothetical protein